MHRFRREAKYAAWYDKDEEPHTYNPFRKIRENSKLSTRPRNTTRFFDESNEISEAHGGLHLRALSDPDFRPESAAQSEREFDQPPPPHASTSPDLSTSGPTTPKPMDEIESLKPAESVSLPDEKADIESVVEEEQGKPTDARFTVVNQLKTVFLNSWINILLLAVPAGFALRYTVGYSVATFVVNLFATIPLVLLVGLGADEVQVRLGEALGSLINISASNIAQFITSILLLKSRQVLVLRTGLVGGILCSVLLVLGLSFFAGGIDRKEQHYNLTMAHTSANMLSLASTSLLVPTVSRLLKQTSDVNVTRQSRGSAILLLLVYVAFVIFQLHTHKDLLGQPDKKSKPRQRTKGEASQGIANIGGHLAASTQGKMVKPSKRNEGELDDIARVPTLTMPTSIATLVISTVILTFNADFAVNSIDKLSQNAHLPKNFIGLILLPLVNNVDPGPMLFAKKDQMSITLNITVGKCLQTALLITPLMVIVAWCMGVDGMTLYFDGFEVASLFSSVILLNYLIIDAKSTWVQGILLVADWGMIALAAFFADA